LLQLLATVRIWTRQEEASAFVIEVPAQPRRCWNLTVIGTKRDGTVHIAGVVPSTNFFVTVKIA
jgi:hypothetical protein